MQVFGSSSTAKGMFVPTDEAAPTGLRAAAAGKSANPEVLAGAVAATAAGSILFNANPSAGDYVEIGDTQVMFVNANAVGNQVVIGANTAASVAALQAFLAASQDVNIASATYAVDGGNTAMLDVTAVAAGSLGNGNPEIAAFCATPATIVALTGGSTVPSLSLDRSVSELTVNGAAAQNFSLPNGDEGQRKVLILQTKSAAGNAVVTPVAFDGSHTTITFSAVNQFVELMFLNGGWRVLTNVGATLA
jgi:hypothetical protein